MNTTTTSKITRFKVGVFTMMGLALIVVYTVLVNNRPFWWRPCQLVRINVEDATGLKTKAPIRSLGIEIGYLKSVMLTESHVTLGICITAPVEILPTTRAYIRGEGFLGDKFVELKPVKYVGKNPAESKTPEEGAKTSSSLWDLLFPSAYAAAPTGTVALEDPATAKRGKGREIPVGQEGQDVEHLVERVDDLVQQMTHLTDNLKQAINPEDMRKTMKQLNQTLENASKTLAPEGGLNQTAQRSLAKLEDAIEQLRDMMTRVNRGEGSVGMLLNDPSYAEEIREAVKNINRLLSRVGGVRFVVDLGAGILSGYNGSRGWLDLGIWPKKDRYYRIGIASDSRGRINNMTVATTAGGVTQTTQTLTTEPTGILITGMIGKVFFDRLDLSIGALYNDGAASVALRLGPTGTEEMFELRTDAYSRTAVGSIDARITLKIQPFGGVFKSVYVRGGLESVRNYTGTSMPPFFYGGGLAFDDEDIKLLFALR